MAVFREKSCKIKAFSRGPLAGGLLAAAMAMVAAPCRAETLADAIALAYESNPTLQGQRASLRALDESYVQAEAGYRPTATLQATITNDSNNNTNPYTRSLPGLSQQIINGQSETSGAAIGVTQPIYTGGRVATQISAAEASILAGRETLRGSEETVLRDVINAYADVRRDQQIVTILEADVGLLLAQLVEARARFAVGDITRTDVAETEARVAAAQAELASAKAQLANSRAEYASVVGRNPGDLAPEPPLTGHLPATLDAAFDRAERNSPPIRQADFTEQSSAAKLAQAKTQTRPTLSLQATVGYTGGNYNVIATPFAHYSHDLNVAAVFSMPIFTGGTTSSQIRQAAETNNADRIGVEAARRQTLLAVSQAWNGLIGARANVDADNAQVTAANLAYEGSRQEARVGLRSTLDVLIAEQTLAAAQVALVNARHDEYVAAADLLSATGVLYAQDFAPDVQIYDTKANLKHALKVWPWAPWSPAVARLDSLDAPKIRPIPSPPPAEP
jgi:outer membrane protein